ncbi:MAG: winged helix-turn-helix transcriptional regulator [Ignisphaera sp.]|nr:winged helix-turn-helix transcriptional regulator [Ignisphaera sp.]MDW8085736.1 winged helix-turn-helix transcriptional regulator [Ignisphaera sp.]
MDTYGLLIVIFLICFLSTSASPVLYAQDSVMITINEHGVVSVEIHAHLNDGLQIVEAPVEPIPETIVAVADGEPIPVMYENRTLYLIVQESSSVNISYIANVSIVDSIFYLLIETNITTTLRIPVPNVVLLTVPREIVSYEREGNTLTLTIRGPQELRYTLRPPQISPPIKTTPTDTQWTTQPSMGQPNYVLWISTAGLIAVAAVVGMYLYLKKRRPRELIETLNDVDVAIIKVLDAKGGSALQAELQNSINIPKTTLWRHIRKLEKLGIVRIEKVGLQNRIILVKRVRV